jgi:hypothetical protein
MIEPRIRASPIAPYGSEQKIEKQDEMDGSNYRISVDNIPRLWRYLLCCEALERFHFAYTAYPAPRR